MTLNLARVLGYDTKVQAIKGKIDKSKNFVPQRMLERVESKLQNGMRYLQIAHLIRI